jgi:hypothetical protein
MNTYTYYTILYSIYVHYNVIRPNSGCVTVGRMLSSIDYVYAMSDTRCVLVSDKSGGFCKFDVRKSTSSSSSSSSSSATSTTSHTGKHSTSSSSSGGSINSGSNAVVKQYTASQSNRLISYKAQFSVCASEMIAVIPGAAITSATANGINTNSCLHTVDIHSGRILKSIDSGLRNVTVARNLYDTSSKSSSSSNSSGSSSSCYDTDGVYSQTASLQVWCASYMNEHISRLALRPLCSNEPS